MAQRFDHVRLEKGMYHEAGRSFTQVLEKLDPSEQYRGTALEGLDAYQRQLKRFDIRVKGAGSDLVDKFFSTSQSAVLFPEYIARAVKVTTAPLPPCRRMRSSSSRWPRAPPSPRPPCAPGTAW